MTTNIKKLILTGVAAALVSPALTAATINLVTVGGNASIKLIQDCVPNAVLNPGSVLNVNSTNTLIFRYTGTLTNTTKTVMDFNLTGGAAAIRFPETKQCGLWQTSNT